MSEIELQDMILRHSLQLLRLSAGEQREVEAILRELERELKLLMASRNISASTKKELAALIKEAEAAIRPAYAKAAASTDTHRLALIVAEKTVEMLEDAIPQAVHRVTAETLASLTKDVIIDGAPSSAWWEKQGDDLSFRFAAQVRQGVINGETNEKIVARIAGGRSGPGIMDVARRNARALVHSSVMAASNDARLATFRRNARFIKGVRWLATLDGHTCARCAALDGQAWSLDGEKLTGTKVEFQAPPIHWNDRCVLSPIPKSEADEGPTIGARASSQGPVAANTTFGQWFARQSRAQQDAQFGKARAQLFRDGKITIRDLVSGTGRELTLDELT